MELKYNKNLLILYFHLFIFFINLTSIDDVDMNYVRKKILKFILINRFRG